MATAGSNTKRSVQMDVEVSTSGCDGVRTLANEIRKLGQDGSEAGAEFQRLASELDAVAAQADSIKAIANLDAELRKAATAAVETAAATEKMNLAFQEASSKTLAASEKYAALVAQQSKLRDENKATALTLADLKLNTDAVVAATSAHQEVVRSGKNSINENKKALLELSSTLAESKAELNAAEAAEKRLADGLTKAAKASDAANAALRDRTAALEGAQASAGALGVQTDNLVVAQERLSRDGSNRRTRGRVGRHSSQVRRGSQDRRQGSRRSSRDAPQCGLSPRLLRGRQYRGDQCGREGRGLERASHCSRTQVA